VLNVAFSPAGRFFRPDGPILLAQAEGLGKPIAAASALKGPFAFPWKNVSDPFRVESNHFLKSQAFGLG
jgi:hypothetical protein